MLIWLPTTIHKRYPINHLQQHLNLLLLLRYPANLNTTSSHPLQTPSAPSQNPPQPRPHLLQYHPQNHHLHLSSTFTPFSCPISLLLSLPSSTHSR